jgi:hypothetical protein
MKKMGWAEGKGLGAHEQGRTEAVKVFKKIDRRGFSCSSFQFFFFSCVYLLIFTGIGSEGPGAVVWAEASRQYNSILARLSAQYGRAGYLIFLQSPRWNSSLERYWLYLFQF